jgi:hypothetical protein
VGGQGRSEKWPAGERRAPPCGPCSCARGRTPRAPTRGRSSLAGVGPEQRAVPQEGAHPRGGHHCDGRAGASRLRLEAGTGACTPPPPQHRAPAGLPDGDSALPPPPPPLPPPLASTGPPLAEGTPGAGACSARPCCGCGGSPAALLRGVVPMLVEPIGAPPPAEEPRHSRARPLAPPPLPAARGDRVEEEPPPPLPPPPPPVLLRPALPGRAVRPRRPLAAPVSLMLQQYRRGVGQKKGGRERGGLLKHRKKPKRAARR